MKKLLTLLALYAAATMTSAPALADEAPSSEQGVFVVSLTLGESANRAADQEVLAGHIAYLNALFDQGVLYLAGPFADTYHEGQAIILADSAEDATALISADPSVKAGLMTVNSVHPWWTAFSLPDNRRLTAEQFAAMAAEAPKAEAAAASSGEAAAAAEAEAAASESGGMEMAPGAINWIEIPSSNPTASQAFYSKVFGWEVSTEADMHFYTAPGGVGGLFSPESKPAAPHSGPVFYVNCEGAKAKLEEVVAAGGQAVTEVMTLPNNWGFIAIITDPEGNQVGIWSATE